jgi:hypothetical protein
LGVPSCINSIRDASYHVIEENEFRHTRAANIFTPLVGGMPVSKAQKAKCPFNPVGGGGTSNKDWWPNHLPLELLSQHSTRSNPQAPDFNYAREFNSLGWPR